MNSGGGGGEVALNHLLLLFCKTLTDRVNTGVFNLHQVKRRGFLLGHPVY